MIPIGFRSLCIRVICFRCLQLIRRFWKASMIVMGTIQIQIQMRWTNTGRQCPEFGFLAGYSDRDAICVSLVSLFELATSLENVFKNIWCLRRLRSVHASAWDFKGPRFSIQKALNASIALNSLKAGLYFHLSETLKTFKFTTYLGT